MRDRMAGLAAAAVSSVLIVGAVALGSAPSSAAAQALEWTPCAEESLAADGFECARLSVPLDRNDASIGEASLALVRHRSTGTADDRIGSLVFNPGGPGGSGLQAIGSVWSVVPAEVKHRFDLVSWDPRGVNASTPVLRRCATPYPDRPLTGAVDWATVAREYARTLAAANRACEARNASVVGHLGTNENVEDLDRIRQALGEEKLTYWGMSYGTRIGYVYALAHPDRVRAIVLDGSIDPAGSQLGLTQGGAAPDQAFGVFADAYPEAAAQLRGVLGEVDQRTVPLPDGTALDRWTVIDIVYGQVAQQGAYAAIATFVEAWHATVFGTGQEQLEAAQLSARLGTLWRTIPNSNAGGVFSVVNCLDYAGRPTVARAIAAIRYQDRLGPVNGGSLATMYSLGCSGLAGLTPDPVPVITGAGSLVPVLILGASRDGSTIVQWTARMSRAFPSSRTVTYAGGQHVTWGLAGSACVDKVADRYVITGQLPAMDRGCPNTVHPQ